MVQSFPCLKKQSIVNSKYLTVNLLVSTAQEKEYNNREEKIPLICQPGKFRDRECQIIRFLWLFVYEDDL